MYLVAAAVVPAPHPTVCLSIISIKAPEKSQANVRSEPGASRLSLSISAIEQFNLTRCKQRKIAYLKLNLNAT